MKIGKAEIKLPKLKLPKIKLPKTDFSKISSKIKPVIKKLPKIKLPKVKLPEFITRPRLKKRIRIKIDPMLISISVLFAVAVLSAVALALTYNLTADRIEENERRAYEEANRTLGEHAYQFEVYPKGYGGEIRMLVGISETGEVTGVAVLDMNETLGVGTRTRDPEFLDRFIGKRAGVSIGRGANNIDAVTGATVSSRAIAEGVREALDEYARIIAAEIAAEEAGDE